jgi:hypothetical protein
VSLSSPDPALALLPGRALLSAGGRLLERAAGEGWEGALEALDGLLAEARPRGGARISLSHHFARVLLLSPPPVRLSAAEMDGWVAEQLNGAYGAEAAAWRPVWQDVPPGRAVPVALMDGARYDQLRERIKAHGLSLGQAMPWFVVVWNRHRRRIGHTHGWLALVEPERLVLARIEGGRPVSLRTAQVGPAPADDLAALVTRESLHHDAAAGTDIWLAAAGIALPGEMSFAGRRVHLLSPAGAHWNALLP